MAFAPCGWNVRHASWRMSHALGYKRAWPVRCALSSSSFRAQPIAARCDAIMRSIVASAPAPCANMRLFRVLFSAALCMSEWERAALRDAGLLGDGDDDMLGHPLQQGLPVEANRVALCGDACGHESRDNVRQAGVMDVAQFRAPSGGRGNALGQAAATRYSDETRVGAALAVVPLGVLEPRRRQRGRPRQQQLPAQTHDIVSFQPDPVPQFKLPSVPKELMIEVLQDPLVPKVVNPMAKYIKGAIVRLKRSQLDIDKNSSMAKVVNKSFNILQHRPVVSVAAEEQQLNVDRKLIRASLCKAAEIAIAIDRLSRASIEKALVVAPSITCLHYVEPECYDETPMPLKLRDMYLDSDFAVLLDFLQVLAPSWVVDGGILPDRLPKMLSSARTEAATSKLLQVDSRWAALVEVTWHGARKLMIIHPQSINNLVVLDRVTGEATRAALQQQWGVSLAAEQFGQRTGVCTTDKGSANQKCERGVRAQDRFGWGHMHLYCEVHISHVIHRSTFNYFAKDISGMIRLALSLKIAGQLGSYSKVLRGTIMSRIVIRFGPQPADAIAYRARALRMLCSAGRSLISKFVALNKFPNGDWRRHDCIEIWLDTPPNRRSQVDEYKLKRLATEGIVFCFAAKAFMVYPKYRWTGADECVDQFLGLGICHGLLSASYPSWARSMGVKAGRSASTGGLGLAALPLEGPGEDVSGDGQVGGSDAWPDDREGGHQRETMEEPIHEKPARDGIADADGLTWASLNAEHRRVAAAWAAGDPLFPLIVMRLALVPLADMLRVQLDMAGKEWEARQRGVEMQFLRDGGDARDSPLRRSYRLCELAEGKVEARFFDRLRTTIMEPSVWSLVLPRCITEAANAFTFKVLSKAGCLVEQLMASVHRGFPYRLFRLIRQPDLATELRATKRCLLGPFAEVFLDSNDLALHVTRLRLATIALVSKVDISHVEVLHASIRRLLYVLSTQFPTIDLARESAEWVAARVRSRSKHALRIATEIFSKDGDEPGEGDDRSGKRHKGGGGPWRAFVALSDPGRFKDFSDLAARYHNLSDEETQQYEIAGAQATRIHRERPHAPSFGPTKRALEREA